MNAIRAGRCLVALGIAAGFAHAQSTVPLADLHFHAEPGLTPNAMLGTMDRAGVRWAGNGPKGADTHWRPFVAAAPDRFIPFAGQSAIGTRVQSQGEAAWMLKSPELNRYLDGVLEPALRAGRVKGIGELFVNNEHSHARDFQPTRYPADSPLMQRLFAMSATYHVPLSVHMEANPVSIEELEHLLPTNRDGVVIWAHCGFWAEAAEVQRLMDRHPNLLCELSHRDDRVHSPRLRVSEITGSGRRLKTDWKSLLEKHSDRFLIGTDVDEPEQYQPIIGFYREVIAQLSPEAADRFARGNAIRLFHLAP